MVAVGVDSAEDERCSEAAAGTEVVSTHPHRRHSTYQVHSMVGDTMAGPDMVVVRGTVAATDMAEDGPGAVNQTQSTGDDRYRLRYRHHHRQPVHLDSVFAFGPSASVFARLCLMPALPQAMRAVEVAAVAVARMHQLK